jgi:hypothetical protein
MLLISVSFSITGYSDQSNTQNKKKQFLEVISIEYPPHIIKDSLAESPVFKYLDHLLHKSYLVSKPKIIPLPRAQLIMDNGKWCASLIEPSLSTAPIKKLLLSDKQTRFKFYRVRQNTEFKWKHLNELSGSTLGVFRSRGGSIIDDWRAAGIKIVRTNSVEQALELLLHKRVDLIFSDDNNIEYLLAQRELQNHLQGSINVVMQSSFTVWFNTQCEQAKSSVNYLLELPEIYRLNH